MIRKYASFREGGTKLQKEMSVVSDLLGSMARAREEVYFELAASARDPPDCIARGARGERIAIEVVELVCQTTVETNQRTSSAESTSVPSDAAYRMWERPKFLTHLQRLLNKKDGKTLLGGPFPRVAVVVHTDETELSSLRCNRWLWGHSFGPFQQVTEAYLMFSYEPKVGYPYLQLPLQNLRCAAWGLLSV